MSKPPRGLLRHRSGDHAVVLIHGICQAASGLNAFADALNAAAPQLTVIMFDYDWTRRLEVSGRHLAVLLDQLPYAGLTLVGYSMGGLVARLAASEMANERLRTTITIATPNNGSLDNAELTPLGQAVAAAARLVAPLFPAPGVMDLTRVEGIMKGRRAKTGVSQIVDAKRYASVPALYFGANRTWFPVASRMGLATFAMAASGLIRKPTPHDGIVSELSCRVVGSGRSYSEIDFAKYDRVTPPRCHAHHIAAEGCDHITILDSPEIVQVVVDLAVGKDWRRMPGVPDLKPSVPQAQDD